ncbi:MULTISPECIES: galactose mutarotase [unclassified Microbacterium]|uniref:aldose epimerase family protein n=1 Tax=unclassified Microbacterium TaxID=2609290 RepID=UPI001605521A|nr:MULTISPECIES: galactose mutarotase [unclassified Microbacterium]QNA93595.1 galactose mutarotase [Microbacterium sp. Se63.02b]QYM63854.1 galactose mutarotase [Microbacterium sp. Se5.02b]
MAETRISAGAWSARVESDGCTLRSVEHEGRPLLSAPPELDWTQGHHGAVLAPWPGRIIDSRYRYDDLEQRVPVNEPAFGHSLHGFVFDASWQRVAVDAASVTHEITLGNKPGYPFEMHLRVTYRLDEKGICCESEWKNMGRGTAPFGLGFHPYLMAGGGVNDEWMLHVEASVSSDSDPLTKRPMPPRPTDATSDFVTPRRIGGERFSRAYGRLARHDGLAVVRVTAQDGFTIELSVDEGFRWLQVFTADVPSASLARRGIAIEPQTCPPDAFNSHEDLQRLAPGESNRASWFLRIASA